MFTELSSVCNTFLNDVLPISVTNSSDLLLVSKFLSKYWYFYDSKNNKIHKIEHKIPEIEENKDEHDINVKKPLVSVNYIN